ncbi:hypothetical protein [Paenibacillus pedocola]|uniref:hypothetical protein n=1 Tax=Paenibacillus pedocola TaxID=3242193 RepID=UPI002877F320|nr:hypothetical protein [Paenibacillus typhae]
MRAVKHIMLWVISSVLYTLAYFGLELLEGNKISTTDYYGFRNLGFVTIFLMYLLSSVLYPIVLFPLAWVVRKLANPFIDRLMILALSGIGGYVLFHMSYESRFIEEYHLDSRTAIILYVIAGFIYVLVDYYLEKTDSLYNDSSSTKEER